MSINVNSKVGYPTPWIQDRNLPAATVDPKVNSTAPKDPAAPAAPPPVQDTFEATPAPAQNEWANKFAADPTGADNVFAQEQLEKGGWSNDTVATKQNTDTDCGAAVATMLGSAKNPLGEEGQRMLMDDLQQQFGSEKGTTPDQMTKMLAHVGVEVRRADTGLDRNALAGTLSMGGKTAAMVDSNTIRPDGKAEPGAAHWVVVDGMNDKGDYRVRDPSDGSSYYVAPEKLSSAIDTARSAHNSGGMLYVENAQASEQDLLTAGGDKSTALGKDPGTGSKSWKFSTEG